MTCGQNQLSQALEPAREIVRQETTASSSVNPYYRTTPVSMDNNGDTAFRDDPVIHLRLNTVSTHVIAHTATLSAFTDSVPKDHTLEVMLANTQRVCAPFMPPKAPHPISGAVTIDNTPFTVYVLLSSGVSATFRFNCRGLLGTESAVSPQSSIY